MNSYAKHTIMCFYKYLQGFRTIVRISNEYVIKSTTTTTTTSTITTTTTTTTPDGVLTPLCEGEEVTEIVRVYRELLKKDVTRYYAGNSLANRGKEIEACSTA